MEHTVPTDQSPPAGVRSWHLWFGLAAGVVVWMIHLTAVYALTSLTCEWGWFESSGDGLTGLQVVQIALTVVAAAITIVAGLLALRGLRRMRDTDAGAAGRHRFMAQLAVGLNLIFTALIVISLVPVLTLPQCG
jgi:hypothetical protein